MSSPDEKNPEGQSVAASLAVPLIALGVGGAAIGLALALGAPEVAVGVGAAYLAYSVMASRIDALTTGVRGLVQLVGTTFRPRGGVEDHEIQPPGDVR